AGLRPGVPAGDRVGDVLLRAAALVGDRHRRVRLGPGHLPAGARHPLAGGRPGLAARAALRRRHGAVVRGLRRAFPPPARHRGPRERRPPRPRARRAREGGAGR
ncbi:Protein of unknown function, partial [Gryllus bimaculatus]